jgi:hypothetical protein
MLRALSVRIIVYGKNLAWTIGTIKKFLAIYRKLMVSMKIVGFFSIYNEVHPLSKRLIQEVTLKSNLYASEISYRNFNGV